MDSGFLKQPKTYWIIAALLLLAAIIFPIPYLVIYAEYAFFEKIAEFLLADYAFNTYYLMALTAFWALFFAVPSAWVVSNYNFPLRKFFQAALYLPLAIPSYIAAYTYKGIFGAYGTSHAYLDFYFEIDSPFYLSIIMGAVLYPYIYAVGRAVFEQQSVALLRASANLGVSPIQTFFKVVLPLAIPAILGGLMLVMMEVLSNYGAVKYFGIDTFTTEVIRWWSPMGYGRVIALSFSILIIVLLLFGLKKIISRRGAVVDKFQIKVIGQAKQIRGAKAIVAFLLCLFPVLIGFIIPVLQLLQWACWSWTEVWTSDFFRLLANTFKMAIIAASITVMVAVLLRYSLRIYNRLWFRYAISSSLIGYALPGVVIGIGILVPLTQLNQNYGILLTDAVFILIWAYCIRFFAVAYQSVDGAFNKLSPSLYKASKNMGKGNWYTLFWVELPNLKTGLTGALILVFVDVTKELPLTMLFQSFNFETLAIRAFHLMETDGAVYAASVPSLIIVLLGLLPVILLNRLNQSK